MDLENFLILDLHKPELVGLKQLPVKELKELLKQIRMATNQIQYISKFVFFFTLFCVSPADITSDLYRNQLHFGYGINYKYNGQLYHNLDRVWVVHRVVIPKAEDLESLPSFPDNVNCYPSIRGKVSGHNANLQRKAFNSKICLLTRPHIKLLARQAKYFKAQVSKLIREDLYHALHSLHPVSHFEYKRIKRRELSPNPLGWCWKPVSLLTQLPHFKTFHLNTFQETGQRDY